MNHTTDYSEVVKIVYTAINRNEFSALIPYFDPQIERIEPEGFPMSGTYLGREKVLSHFSQARGSWAEGACEPGQVRIVGDKVVVPVTVRVRLKDREDWIEGSITDAFVFRDGKIVLMRTFVDSRQAMDWAGL